MKILPILLTVAFSSSYAQADYPVKRIEGTIVFVNKDFTGMRVLSENKIVTVELAFGAGMREYEMGLPAAALRVGDEISMAQKGRGSMVYNKTVTGIVEIQNPLTFSVKVYPRRTGEKPEEGVFQIEDYATLVVKRQITKPFDSRSDTASFASGPTHIKTYTIIKPERVEFIRFHQRKLSDLAVGQKVSIYMAALPKHRFRSRGLAILVSDLEKNDR